MEPHNLSDVKRVGLSKSGSKKTNFSNCLLSRMCPERERSIIVRDSCKPLKSQVRRGFLETLLGREVCWSTL